MTYTEAESPLGAAVAPAGGPSSGTSPSSLPPEEAQAPGGPQAPGAVVPPVRGRLAALREPEALVTLFVVAICVVFVAWQFQLSQVFKNTTISGGDTGAHVLLPWVVIHQLLPNLRLTGWTSSNWDGFPAVTFYFPLPVYAIVAATPVLGFDIAFKVMTALPMVAMPLAGWLLGRLARAPFPVPAVLAVSVLPFIFGNEFEIYGGNILSTLAGEFAFAWSLWFALVFFGLVIRGLQTGRYRAWAAVCFACCFMSHIDPVLFAVVGLLVLLLSHAVRTRDWLGTIYWALPTMCVGIGLAAWWAWPYAVRLHDGYLTDMGYTRNTAYLTSLFPRADTWLFVLAAVGAGLCIARRLRIGQFLIVMTVLSAVAFRYMPQSILWNNRVLPFWFLCLYLLAGLAVSGIYSVVAERSTGFNVTLRAALLPAPLLVMVLGLTWVGFPLRILPGERASSSGDYSFLGIPQTSASVIPSWITWNYSGYEAGCPGDEWQTAPQSCEKSRWPEYEQIVQQLQKVSKTYGCGSVMWEYNSSMNNYGTPDALTILPYWTNGCIGSMEGLYYEASATTPFHFINQSELSLQPSDPMVGLTYASAPGSPQAVDLGIQHLQMLGVKYYMAINTQLQTAANADPNVKLIDRFGPFSVNYGTNSGGPNGTVKQYWDLYLVKDAPRVRPLANQPVVMDGLRNTSQPKWLEVMQNWYLNPSDWDVYVAAEGPSNWERVQYGSTTMPVKPEPTTRVSDVHESNAAISFNVSRVGVPVVVAISYFPNWKVSGAEGPYRVSPNLMVVVPTSHHVRLWYGTTAVDVEGYLLTFLAVFGLAYLAWRPMAPMASIRRRALGQRGAGHPQYPPGPVHAALVEQSRRFWAGDRPPLVPAGPGPGAPGTPPAAVGHMPAGSTNGGPGAWQGSTWAPEGPQADEPTASSPEPAQPGPCTEDGPSD
ncbi:MAG TPA: hypothetical protein VME46_06725 [Acidimicrobiales bacterium]|nr:hypothetical protein [Acidimicrobiales bacterium]